MKSEHYSKFSGIDQTTNRSDAPQNSYLKLNNIVLSDKKGELTRRGGSQGWSATGSILGLFGYSETSGTAIPPNTTKILRHRRDGSTSYIENLNYSTSAWDARTLGAQTAFGIDGIAQAAQYNNILVICAGRPAYFSSASSDINRLGGPAPTAAPTWGSSGTGLSGSTRGFYTFRNSTTSWESSPSPVTDLLIISNKQIDWSAMETTCAKEGVDKKRLYRTELTVDGAGTFKLVAEINLATTTYSDTVADDDLGVEGPATGDHDPPPTTSYICITYANKIVVASGNELWFSKTYDPETHGINGGLEYFSLDRVRRFPAKITGLAFTPDFGKLLVFLPVGIGIHYVSGRSDDTFQQDVFKDKEGTNFPPSISWHDEQIAYLGGHGPSIIDTSGRVINLAAGLDLKDYIQTEYNSTVYVSSAHVDYPTSRFIFAFCGTSTNGAEWEDSVTGVTVEWEDTVTGALVTWEIN